MAPEQVYTYWGYRFVDRDFQEGSIQKICTITKDYTVPGHFYFGLTVALQSLTNHGKTDNLNIRALGRIRAVDAITLMLYRNNILVGKGD